MTITAQKQGQSVSIHWPDSEATLAHITTTDPHEALRALLAPGAAVEIFVAIRSVKEQHNEPTTSGAR
jgi:hypothetical protein